MLRSVDINSIVGPAVPEKCHLFNCACRTLALVTSMIAINEWTKKDTQTFLRWFFHCRPLFPRSCHGWAVSWSFLCRKPQSREQLCRGRSCSRIWCLDPLHVGSRLWGSRWSCDQSSTSRLWPTEETTKGVLESKWRYNRIICIIWWYM